MPGPRALSFADSVVRVFRPGAILLTVMLTACASAGPRSTAMPAAPAVTYSTGVAWVTRSAEYHAAVLQTYRQALTAIEDAARGGTTGGWAVILDADETLISNLAYQQELERAGQSHSSALWTAWVRRREAVPMPGAKAFLDRIRTLGGRIAIVTNRLESECADTRAVFEQHALVYDVVLCRPDAGPSDKNPRFAAVAGGAWPGASGPLRVVAWVGDNIQDFPSLTQAVRQQGDGAFSDFGVRFFVLPNPMYGSWQ
jgi:5'-nucleotidase (lipoprotein e(P4) family)